MATKTLEATLVTPTAHKEQKLQETLAEYRAALQDAFDAGCATMSATNEVVTPYNLPYQAKDALKSFVPHLINNDAEAVRDEHPLRLVNRAARFDRDDSRTHELCWQVPQPGRGTNFWIPLRINPEQEDLWVELLTGAAEAGDLQLQRHRTTWVLHVTVHNDIEDADGRPDDPTYIGFDIGESALITGCALKRETPTKPILESGSRARRLRKELFTTLRRLRERDAAVWRIEERVTHYQNALTDIVENASRRAVEYARGFKRPAIVLEDLSYIRDRLDYGAWMNRRVHTWAFARLQGRIEDKAHDAGIPVVYVNAAYTSQTCHACKHIGRRSTQAAFECTNPDCHISTFHADINAAANIARRADPWGESVPWKSGRDDSPRDGSGRVTATAHRE